MGVVQSFVEIFPFYAEESISTLIFAIISLWRTLRLLPRIILNKFAWNSSNCFKEEVLKKVVYLFTLFLILHMYLPIGFGKVWRFIYASKPKFSFLAMMFCAELGWNWPRGSGDDEIVKSLCRQQRWGQLE